MDKINEAITWLMLVMFGCWFTKTATPRLTDRDSAETAPCLNCHDPLPSGDNLTSRPEYNPKPGGDILSAGLSELLKRQKSRANLGRRKEDCRPESFNG